MSTKSQLIKIKSHTYCVALLNAIPYEKLSHWYGFQAHHPPVISSTRMLLCILYSLIILLLKSTMVIFFIFQLLSYTAKTAKSSFYTVHRVVREKLNFGLRVCRIFSCVINIDLRGDSNGRLLIFAV